MRSTAKRSPTERLPRICVASYLLLVASIAIYVAFTKSVAFADWWNEGIGSVGRRLFAYLFAWLPVSFAELLVLLIPMLVPLVVYIGFQYFCDSVRAMLTYIGILLSVVALIGSIFIWNFAAGYWGRSLDQKLGLDRRDCSAEELYLTAELLSQQMHALSDEIVFLEDGFSVMPYSYEEMNEKLLDAYDSFAADHDFIDHFYSRVKPIMLSEPMSYTHITGVYSFFTGEANINVNFPDYCVPFTAAHELAHQRGISREDEANFVAFLVCMESDDPYIRYSACLNLYEYVANALAEADTKRFYESYGALPVEVQREEAAYSEFFEKYRDNVAADISDATNDSYLQLQGVPQGSRSYNLVVDLAVAYFRPRFS